jgi:hypothetical protein
LFTQSLTTEIGMDAYRSDPSHVHSASAVTDHEADDSIIQRRDMADGFREYQRCQQIKPGPAITIEAALLQNSQIA